MGGRNSGQAEIQTFSRTSRSLGQKSSEPTQQKEQLTLSFQIQKVSDLMTEKDTNPPGWDLMKLNNQWDSIIVNSITQILVGGQDIRCWGNETAGTCSVKAIYQCLQNSIPGPHFPWTQKWKIPIAPQPSFFFSHGEF